MQWNWMQVAAFLMLAIVVVQAEDKKPIKKLQIGVKKRVDNCDIKSRKGDSLSMHYTVSIIY